MVVVGILLPIISIVPPFNSFGTQKDFIGSFADAGVFVLLALGLNVVVGFAGLLDLGYAAFFAIGAYTMAYGASGYSGLDIPFWIMLWVGLIVAALFGLLLGAPTLRLRGDYLAIVTLGFGEIVPVVFLNADSYTNGTNGITGIAQPSLYGLFGINGFGFTDPLPYYVTMLLIVTLAMVLLYRLQDSRLGRAWVALREDELAAASMGINTVSTKLLAFAIGASTAGFAGVFYSAKLASVTPQEFDFTVSFTALAMVVLGGMGNIWGVAVGAFIIYLLQHQALKQLTNAVHSAGLLQSIDFTNYQYLLYGLALVGMMLLRPEGLFPSRRRRQELHAATADVEATAVDAVSEA
jgi:ABC-type branched-subunit amino acid transport system permease subunit